MGFLFKINIIIDDVFYNVGFKKLFDNDLSIDLLYIYGENSIDYIISDIINGLYVNYFCYN